MATITKRDMIERIAERTNGNRAEVKEMLQTFLDQVIVELKRGNRIEFRDFGVFELRKHSGRLAHNPKTLERLVVPPKVTVKFKVGRLLRETLDDAPESDNGTGPTGPTGPTGSGGGKPPSPKTPGPKNPGSKSTK